MAGELMSLSASSVVIDVPLFPMPFAMPFTGIVHPNIYILLSFTHPQVVPTCMNVFLLLNTNEDILKNVGNRAVLGHN